MNSNELLVKNNLALKTKISFGKFSWELVEYYNGKSGKPDINKLIREINDRYLPQLVEDKYRIDDVILLYQNIDNLKYLGEFIENMLNRAFESSEIKTNPAFFSPSDITPLLVLDIYDKRDLISALSTVYEINYLNEEPISSTVPIFLNNTSLRAISLQPKKPAPTIAVNYEIGFNINLPVNDLIILLKLFKKLGAKYMTPIRYKPGVKIALTAGSRNKYLEEFYDRQRLFIKEVHKGSLTNINQSYKSPSFKMFAEAISIDSFDITDKDSMEDILGKFNLIMYKKIPPKRSYAPRDWDENDSSDWGYTQDDLRDMYREAFDGNPDAEWNID